MSQPCYTPQGAHRVFSFPLNNVNGPVPPYIRGAVGGKRRQKHFTQTDKEVSQAVTNLKMVTSCRGCFIIHLFYFFHKKHHRNIKLPLHLTECSFFVHSTPPLLFPDPAVSGFALVTSHLLNAKQIHPAPETM